MKKYFTLVMLACLPLMMMAQDANDKAPSGFDPEMHKQNQHKFMMEKAQLTKEDSVKFFAIYDEMRAKERKIYGDSHKMRNKRPETDAECRAAMLHADSLELAIKKLQYDYHLRLLNAISPKKACIAIMSGEQFDRMALRDMFGGKHAHKGGPLPGKEGPRPGFDGPHPGNGGPGFGEPQPGEGGPGALPVPGGGEPHPDVPPMN